MAYLEMHHLLFGEAGAFATYCCMSWPAASGSSLPRCWAYVWAITTMTFWPCNGSRTGPCPNGLWELVKDILKVKLHVDKFDHGVRLFFLGMQLRLSARGVYFCLSDHCRRKCVEVLPHCLSKGQQGRLQRSQATVVARRLNWSCNALFGRCGWAFLAQPYDGP